MKWAEESTQTQTSQMLATRWLKHHLAREMLSDHTPTVHRPGIGPVLWWAETCSAVLWQSWVSVVWVWAPQTCRFWPVKAAGYIQVSSKLRKGLILSRHCSVKNYKESTRLCTLLIFNGNKLENCKNSLEVSCWWLLCSCNNYIPTTIGMTLFSGIWQQARQIVTILCNRCSERCRTLVAESDFPHWKALSLQSYYFYTFICKCLQVDDRNYGTPRGLKLSSLLDRTDCFLWISVLNKMQI